MNNDTKILGQQYTPWDSFGVEEYVQRNYGRKILDEDLLIIQEVIKAIHSLGIKPKSLKRVADVGAGPNLYPAMLLSPFVKSKDEGGKIDLIELSSANRQYAKNVLEGSDTNSSLVGVWDKFESKMAEYGKEWEGALSDVKEKAQVIQGSIYDLPNEVYDAVSSYFVPESITNDFATFEKAVNKLIGSIKPGSFIMVAHMLGSTGYYAGQNTSFPAVSVDIDDLEKIYKNKVDAQITKVNAIQESRKDYSGMAIVVGKKI